MSLPPNPSVTDQTILLLCFFLLTLHVKIWTKGLIPEVLFTYDKLANACSGHCRSQTTCLAKRQSCLGLPEGRAAASLPARCPERDAPGAHRRSWSMQGNSSLLPTLLRPRVPACKVSATSEHPSRGGEHPEHQRVCHR